MLLMFLQTLALIGIKLNFSYTISTQSGLDTDSFYTNPRHNYPSS